MTGETRQEGLPVSRLREGGSLRNTRQLPLISNIQFPGKQMMMNLILRRGTPVGPSPGWGGRRCLGKDFQLNQAGRGGEFQFAM